MRILILFSLMLLIGVAVFSEEFDFDTPITIQLNSTQKPVDFLREHELAQDVEYIRLRRKLEDLISDEHDYYEDEYIHTNGRTRYPVLRDQNQNYLLLDNLKFHASRKNGEISWSSALIDLNKIKSATMVKNKFLVKAGEMQLMLGHLQILYNFDPGGVLTRFGQVSGIYVSFDIHFKKGQSYDPLIKGMTNQYQTVLQMGTPKQLFQDKLEGSGLELIHLNLNPEEVRQLFKISMEHAIRKEEISKKPYHTLKNSCVTYQFDLISELLGKRVHTYHPSLVVDVLSKHDLVSKVEQVEAPSEIRDYIANHFEADASLEREPIDMVFRAGVGRQESPIKPFFGINF